MRHSYHIEMVSPLKRKSKKLEEIAQTKMCNIKLWKNKSYNVNFELIIWVIKAYDSYFCVLSSCSMIFLKFRLNLLIWEISLRLFNSGVGLSLHKFGLSILIWEISPGLLKYLFTCVYSLVIIQITQLDKAFLTNITSQ